MNSCLAPLSLELMNSKHVTNQPGALTLSLIKLFMNVSCSCVFIFLPNQRTMSLCLHACRQALVHVMGTRWRPQLVPGNNKKVLCMSIGCSTSHDNGRCLVCSFEGEVWVLILSYMCNIPNQHLSEAMQRLMTSMLFSLLTYFIPALRLVSANLGMTLHLPNTKQWSQCNGADKTWFR